MVPPPLMLEIAEDDEGLEPPLPARRWVRVALIAIGLGWLSVFVIAAWINPYSNGRALMEETHRQLGLPPCTFRQFTELPCPSCGMTTSFALLVRGDVVNSLRANFAGTTLALIGMAYIPWSLLSMRLGRWVWMRNVESWLIRIVFGWVALMLIRWAALLVWMKSSG